MKYIKITVLLYYCAVLYYCIKITVLAGRHSNVMGGNKLSDYSVKVSYRTLIF